MHAVLFTSGFLADAKDAGADEAELNTIVSTIARNPLAGDLIPGAGGARKVRFAARGKGKSGGYRTIHYFGGDDVPVFMLALISKGQRGDLSQADRNAIRLTLETLADAYLAGVKTCIVQLGDRR